MKNLILRAATGAVYVALILFCVLCGTPWFVILAVLFTVLAMAEFQNLMAHRARMTVPLRVFDILVGVFLVITPYLIKDAAFQSVNYIVVGFAFVFTLYMPLRMIAATCDRTENPAKSALFSVFSIAYIALAFFFLVIAYLVEWHVVLASFVFIWINDTGAYLSGMSLGKHKLCERLSPKKTWEGFWGGFLLCMAAGWGAAWLLGASDTATYFMWIIYAALVSVFSTFGDLFESLMKRTLGVKDSGHLIPGHGGILDRIDSLLAVAAPALIFSLILCR